MPSSMNVPLSLFFPRCSTFSYHFYLDGNLWPMDMTARHAWKHHLRKAVAVFVFLSLTHHRWGNVKHVLLLMTWKIEVRVTDLVMGWTPCVAEGPGSFIRVTCVSQRPFENEWSKSKILSISRDIADAASGAPSLISYAIAERGFLRCLLAIPVFCANISPPTKLAATFAL